MSNTQHPLFLEKKTAENINAEQLKIILLHKPFSFFTKRGEKQNAPHRHALDGSQIYSPLSTQGKEQNGHFLPRLTHLILSQISG